MTLPTDAAARKAVPVYSGCLRYFPRAIAAVAELSRVANDQHNPGEPLHWSRDKSADHHDCLARHLLEAGTVDTDGQRHSAKVAWRALAALELELEAAEAEPRLRTKAEAMAYALGETTQTHEIDVSTLRRNCATPTDPTLGGQPLNLPCGCSGDGS